MGSASCISVVPCYWSQETGCSAFHGSCRSPYDRQHEIKKNSRAVQPSYVLLLCCLAPGKAEKIHKKANLPREPTFKEFPIAQVPRTRTSSLSLKELLFSIVSLFSHDRLDKRRPLPSRAKGRSQRPVGMVSEHFLSQHRMVTLEKRKNGSSPPIVPTDFGRFKRRGSIKPARFDFGLPFATPSRKRSSRVGRGESSKKMTTVNAP